MPYVSKVVGLSPAHDANLVSIELCQAHFSFKFKGHRVTAKLKSLPSMICILLFAKIQLEPLEYLCASGDIKQIFIFQPLRHRYHPVPGSLIVHAGNYFW